jgi:uncharacterized protein YheU (UPF0270 family)
MQHGLFDLDATWDGFFEQMKRCEHEQHRPGWPLSPAHAMHHFITMTVHDEASDDGAIPAAEGSVEVPYDQLTPETLHKVIEDLVTRDGTDYGEHEKTLEQKAAALLKLLQRGEAKLVVDLATESIGLMTRDELARQQPKPR